MYHYYQIGIYARVPKSLFLITGTRKEIDIDNVSEIKFYNGLHLFKIDDKDKAFKWKNRLEKVFKFLNFSVKKVTVKTMLDQ
jgi:hypothetical protein